MWRIFIITSLVPFLAGGVLAHLFGTRVWSTSADLSESVASILSRLLTRLDRDDIKVSFSKVSPWLSCNDGSIYLPKTYLESKSSAHAARAMIQLGMYLLHEKHSSTVDWRLKAIKTGYILPVFVLLVVSFAFIVAKLPAIVVMASLAGSLGLSSILLWLSLAVEKEAAHLMVSRIEKLRLMRRLRDEESLVSSTLAAPWVSLIPGVLLKFIVRG
ncbi:MAG: hypothetical protein ABGY95_04770 [Rubritalea sp.]|uniref:hypothetical protein n=1 Tax=Rubritalea sp. TaxID=2109375 RepID=UPI003241C9AA